jgi:hypothetical protein
MTIETVSAVINYCGITWQVDFSRVNFEQVLKHIKEMYSQLCLLQPREKFMRRLQFFESCGENSIESMQTVQYLLE